MENTVETIPLAEAAGFPRPSVWCGAAEADGPTVLYVYGGTFAMNRGPMHSVIADQVARNARGRVLMVDYRLAPEHPFPLAIEDVVATCKALLARGVPPSKLVVMGDTAGAGIALAALIALRDEGAPMPAGFVALTPWVDLTMSGGSYVENIRTGRFASDVELLAMLTIDYLQGADPRHPLASPVFGELSGLPETLIHAGADDILLDDARLLVEGLRRVGGRAHLHVWQGLPDTWQRLQPLSPQAAAALASIGQFVRRRTGATSRSAAEKQQLSDAYSRELAEFVQPHMNERFDQLFEWARDHDPDWVWHFMERRLEFGALVTQEQIEHDWLALLFADAPEAMLLLSASRHVILANRRARRVLESGGVFAHKNGRLTGADTQSEDALSVLMDQAFGLVSAGNNFGPADRYGRVANGKGEVFLLRCERIQPPADGSGAPPIALVRIFEEGRRRRIDRDALRAWYGLSPREAELAASFAEGSSLAAFARSEGLSMATVRTHFSRIKSKLGAADQAAVVGKVIRAAFG
ncbi:alpha/beta hydrolase fold domain-containing protein [Parvibaculum sp.]|uniref:alpha/beta hydrolase fold domain-containing protein n=1 Tax=Parvibaculum sp. TaxID=2024848 RepID=UPI001D63D903|nr:alpha/beta hydrolase fold domain-containing protein [Parvibaculum sp.]MBX3489140.1 alpha/beta hydrolase fold domain-containing protein [Parvibaculum sp.]MCW5726987.1 alpha/beta hydrolase fold domain-containing protein [Parvibaculum sp.]